MRKFKLPVPGSGRVSPKFSRLMLHSPVFSAEMIPLHHLHLEILTEWNKLLAYEPIRLTKLGQYPLGDEHRNFSVRLGLIFFVGWIGCCACTP